MLLKKKHLLKYDRCYFLFFNFKLYQIKNSEAIDTYFY